MRNEADVKKKLKETLNAVGAWWYMPPGGPYGRIGVPDFLCCLRGRMIAIETKFECNKPTARQEQEMDAIRKAGGVSWVVTDKTDFDALENTLREIV